MILLCSALAFLAPIQDEPLQDALEKLKEEVHRSSRIIPTQNGALRLAETDMEIIMKSVRDELHARNLLVGTENRFRRLALRITLKSRYRNIPTLLKALGDKTEFTFILDPILRKNGRADREISIDVKSGSLARLFDEAYLGYVVSRNGEILVTAPMEVERLKRWAAVTSSAGSIAYLFSPRLKGKEQEKEILDRVDELEDPKLTTRLDAEDQLIRLGRASWQVLRTLKRNDLDAEATWRLNNVRRILQLRDFFTYGQALDHDITFLSRLKDKRAHARLKKIAGHLGPFRHIGFPNREEGFPRYMHDWWRNNRMRIHWDEETDRFEEN